jgi:peptidoglycan/xylan/chitin deacetylase (PgdA/CDA1 family)
MGLRVRLEAGVNISGLPYQARVVATALERYGRILADNGSPWYIAGAPDAHWNDDALHQLDRLSGRDFEVVDTRSLPHPGG